MCLSLCWVSCHQWPQHYTMEWDMLVLGVCLRRYDRYNVFNKLQEWSGDGLSPCSSYSVWQWVWPSCAPVCQQVVDYIMPPLCLLLLVGVQWPRGSPDGRIGSVKSQEHHQVSCDSLLVLQYWLMYISKLCPLGHDSGNSVSDEQRLRANKLPNLPSHSVHHAHPRLYL